MTAHAEFLCAVAQHGGKHADLEAFRTFVFRGRHAWGVNGAGYEIRKTDGTIAGGPYYSHPDQVDGMQAFAALAPGSPPAFREEEAHHTPD